MPDPPPVAPAVARTAAMGAAREDEPEEVAADFEARAAAGQRPRRIPRRGDAS
jgi:hypothetical protein